MAYNLDDAIAHWLRHPPTGDLPIRSVVAAPAGGFTRLVNLVGPGHIGGSEVAYFDFDAAGGPATEGTDAR